MGPPLEPPEPVRGEDGVLRIGVVGRWPSVHVDSEDFGNLAHSERLRRLALGYIASARALCLELGENPAKLDWPRASVVCFCCYHAVELFLKACILHRVPTKSLGVHDVSQLQQEYRQHYPFDRYFVIQTPWDMSIADIERAFGAPPGTAAREDFEDKRDQVFRYLSDKAGRSPKATYCFAPGTWIELAERLEGNFDRVWGNIQETYPDHIK
jgi:hypothetical protein